MRIARNLSIALVLSLMAPASLSRAAEIRIYPAWSADPASISVRYAPRLTPSDVLDPPDAQLTFDVGSASWTGSTRAGSETITSFSFSVTDTTSNRSALAGLPFAIPVVSPQPRVYRVGYDFLGSPDQEAVKGLYADMSRLKDQEDWLRGFLQAESLINFLQAGRRADEVPLSPTLAHALTVYGETVFWLVGHTEWFGLPANLRERETLVSRLRLSRSTLRDGDRIRLAGADDRLEQAKYLMIKRVWDVSVAGSPFCMDTFPVSRALYRQLASMPDDEYAEAKQAASLTRSVVLHGVVGCFRQLMSFDGNRRYFHEVVVEREFRGGSGRQLLADLSKQLERQLFAIEPAIHAQVRTMSNKSECGGIDIPIAAQLCDDWLFLREVEPLLEDGSGTLRVSSTGGTQ